MTRPLIDEPVTTAELTRSGAAVLLGGGFLANYIFGSSTVIVPVIAARLGIGPEASALVVALFSTGFAASLVLAGRIGDRWGRRRVFAAGLTALALTSTAVAAAPWFGVLLAARVAQGVAAGLVLPQVLATIQATTTGPRRARLSSGYVAALALGATVGQLAGGALSTATPDGWRLVLGSTALLSALVLAGVARVPDSRSDVRQRLDVVGAALFAAAVTAVVLPIALGRSVGWAPWTIGLLAVAVVLLLGFWTWERRMPLTHALMPPVLLRAPGLRAGAALSLLFFAGYGGFTAVYALLTQGGLGMSPLGSGLAFLPFALGFLAASLAESRVSRGRRPETVMRAAALAQAASLLAVGTIVATGWPAPNQWILQPVLVVLGMAQAFMVPPLLRAVMSSVPADAAGLASGILTTAQQVGTAVGVAAFGAVYAAFSGVAAAGFGVDVGLEALMALCFAAAAGLTSAAARAGRAPATA